MLTKNENLILLAERVKERRQSLNISQEELASICEFDRTYISLIERGKRNLAFNNLVILSKGLKLTLSDLLRGI